MILLLLNENCLCQWSTMIYNSKVSLIIHSANTALNRIEVHNLCPSVVLVIVDVEDTMVILNHAGADDGKEKGLGLELGRCS